MKRPAGKTVEVLSDYERIATIPLSPEDLQKRFLANGRPRGFFRGLLGRGRPSSINFDTDSVRSEFRIAALTFGGDQEFAFVEGPADKENKETALWLPKGTGINAAEYLVRRILEKGGIDANLVGNNVKDLRL